MILGFTLDLTVECLKCSSWTTIHSRTERPAGTIAFTCPNCAAPCAVEYEVPGYLVESRARRIAERGEKAVSVPVSPSTRPNY